MFLYNVVDLNGNQTVDFAEIAGRTCTAALSNTGDCRAAGFNLANPANVSSPNHVIGDYSTPMTYEATLGLDHELMPNFGISANATWRKFTNFNWRPLEGIRSDDYEQRGTYTASLTPVGSVSVPYYGVRASQIPANRTRTEYVDREGYHQRYLGLEIAATKRLSNRWMARFGFSTNDHREYFDGANAIADPTPTTGNPNIDGGLVMRQTGGSGKAGIFMVLPRYQFIANGLYQAPWGINLAANMTLREGFVMPYTRGAVATGDPLQNQKQILLVNEVTDYRLPAVTSLDARVGKEFRLNFGGYAPRINLDLDVFNVLNSATVLGREYDLNSTSANVVREIMNPRILRLGLRINF